MSITYQSGAIRKKDKLHNVTLYDVSNMLMTAQFDGRGNISRYAITNKWDVFDCFYSMLSINGKNWDYYLDKEVEMIGRIQRTKLNIDNCDVQISQFVDTNTNAVFTEYDIDSPSDKDIDIVFNFGVNFVSYLKNLFMQRLSLRTFGGILSGYVKNTKNSRKGCKQEDDMFIVRNNVIGDFYLDVAMPKGSKALEKERIYYNQYKISQKIKANTNSKIRFVISAGTRGDFSYCDVATCYKDFDNHYQDAINYIENLPIPKSVKDEKTKAYYLSLINCSVSLYKELGEFKGFIAGINYQAPARTYYRDAYWTVLSVLPLRPDWVRNQVITLSKGIDKDGKCPSAVKSNFKNWWGNHYDSPSFFVIMLYDYVKHTGDLTILDEKWRGENILQAARMVIEKLSEYTDETGLLVKGGEYNRRDWADNVFRHGYVTYDESLYARALQGLAYLYNKSGNDELSNVYNTSYIKVKDSINNILWDEEKGYYVNYKDKDYIEDNLSIDTVITALFSIADESRSIRLLKAMESSLETKNNKLQKAGDYGVMSVYPFYKRAEDTVTKSSLPYYYHNGGDWPYWSSVYAYAKLMYNLDYEYPLYRWFDYNIEKGNYTPIEFYSPTHPDGSLLQGWSSTGAFVLSYIDGNFFR